MTGRVVSLQLCDGHEAPLRFVSEVVALAGRGLDGDIHGAGVGRGRRSVLLVDVETLRHLRLSPGDLREQITVDLPGLQALAAGTRLRVGEAVLELSGPCEPCTHIGEHVGRDPEPFRQSLIGRRGMLAGVVEVVGGGRIRVGDPVEALPTTAPQPSGSS